MNLEHVVLVREPVSKLGFLFSVRRVYPSVIHCKNNIKIYLKSNSLCYRNMVTGQFQKMKVEVK